MITKNVDWSYISSASMLSEPASQSVKQDFDSLHTIVRGLAGI